MKYHIIAIEREYASGGQEIGSRVARSLGIPCYGREILEMAARELRVDIGQIENTEEKATGSIMYSMYLLANLTNAQNAPVESRLLLTESEMIQRVTQTPAVVVGRCAVHSLRDREDVLRVFVHAPMDFRMQRAVSQYHVQPEKAGEVLRRADRRRGNFYKASTGKSWRDIEGYDLILDSSALGIDRCVKLLEACYQG